MISVTIKKNLHGTDGRREFSFDLNVKSKSFTAVYGKSGVGKTSLLRMISGLLVPDSGTIKTGNTTWFDKSAGINIPTAKRNVAFVFQDLALFPNMTAVGNLKFAIHERQDADLLKKVVQIMEIESFMDRNITSLSGGQKQRIALARAILQQPDILLLDEPLSAMDQALQFKLQRYILNAHKEFNLTTIMVSHNVSQIINMADQVIILDNGRVTKSGSPSEAFGRDKLSGKVQFSGEIISIDKEDVIEIATVLVGKDFIKVVITGKDKLEVGDNVLISAKAFNPVIQKVKANSA